MHGHMHSSGPSRAACPPPVLPSTDRVGRRAVGSPGVQCAAACSIISRARGRNAAAALHSDPLVAGWKPGTGPRPPIRTDSSRREIFLVGDLDRKRKRDKKEKGDALALRRCPAAVRVRHYIPSHRMVVLPRACVTGRTSGRFGRHACTLHGTTGVLAGQGTRDRSEPGVLVWCLPAEPGCAAVRISSLF